MSQINNMDTGDRATISMTDRWNADAMDFLNSVLSWIRVIIYADANKGDRAQQLTTYVLTEDAQSEMMAAVVYQIEPFSLPPSFPFPTDESNFFPVTEDRGTGSIFDDKIGAMYLSLWMFTSYMVPILLSASAVT
ncbi:hypothetical protein BDQ17DRAFT_1338108 [Cyathus striatus]|nr:hypothetical protein BDQ17DRAFT_1338108 [Cyathus striatus]